MRLIEANARKNDALYIKQVDELRAQYPGKVRRFRTFEDVLTQFAPDLHRFVEVVSIDREGSSLPMRYGELPIELTSSQRFVPLYGHTCTSYFTVLYTAQALDVTNWATIAM